VHDFAFYFFDGLEVDRDILGGGQIVGLDAVGEPIVCVETGEGNCRSDRSPDVLGRQDAIEAVLAMPDQCAILETRVTEGRQQRLGKLPESVGPPRYFRQWFTNKPVAEIEVPAERKCGEESNVRMADRHSPILPFPLKRALTMVRAPALIGAKSSEKRPRGT
jgi:hypothetical protein